MPRKSLKRKRTQEPTEHSPLPLAYLIGESPLVEEYANLCAAKGYSVLVSWNRSGQPAEGVKRTFYRNSTVIPRKASVAIELTNTDIGTKTENIRKLDKALGPQVAVLTTSVTMTASEQAALVKHKHRVVGFGAMPGFSHQALVEVAPTVHTPRETMAVVQAFFHSLGKEIEVVQDRIGMVLPRILCQIINEATFAIMEDIASPGDIDAAMKLGANYPRGPVEWAEALGIRQLYSVLAALENDLKEDRYRISPLLRQMALSGEWWKSNQQ
jgi:3-hydroxybutyryl-CoA dehydrogenase